MRRTLALSLAAAIVIALNWLRLESPQHAARVVPLLALAIAPALVRPLWPRVAAAVVAAFGGVCLALEVSPLALWPGGARFFEPIGRHFGGGFADFYEFRLPVDPSAHPRMHMLVLLALFAFALATALAIAARRAVLSVASFLIGAGWPATLLAGGNSLGRGAIILAVALVLLAGVTGRATHIAAPAAAAIALGALLLSASPAVAKSAFLDWQHWNPVVRPAKPVSVSYVWDSNYNGFDFPRKVTTVLTVRAPKTIGTYWRATVLDAYVGDRWIEDVWRESPLAARELTPAQALDPGRTVQQEVTVDALADKHLVAASVPVAYNVSEPARYLGQDVAIVRDGLKRGQRYIAWSYVPKPTADALVRSPARYPRALTAPGRELGLGGGVTSPPFAQPGRDALLARKLVGPLAPYAQLLVRARAVAGDTHSPYAAVVALERWFRTTGGFIYSNHPPPTPGLPPLVGFVLDTKTGYCQHFAGAMALMARLLGIPARVAVGFVRGQYEKGEWHVTDHDAHAWVEVWFRGYGWLPFDPTPGRGRLAAAYSAASSAFDPAAEAKLLSRLVRGGEVFGSLVPGTVNRDTRRTPRSAADVGVQGLASPAAQSHRHSLALFLLLLCVGAVAVIAAAKTARRKLRYLTRDPRRLATACARELGEFLADQRLPVPPRPTFGELDEVVRGELAVDPTAFTAAASAARFGPPRGAGDAARSARTELRTLKRTVRRQLFVLDRARGLVSLRSFGFS
jgi:transglutaminase-like putative cysteine protease